MSSKYLIKNSYEPGVGKEVKEWIAMREAYESSKYSSKPFETIVSSIPHQVPYFWSQEIAKQANISISDPVEQAGSNINNEATHCKLESFKLKLLNCGNSDVIFNLAIEANHTRFLELALQSGRDVNCVLTKSGRTLLHVLAAHGDIRKIEVVLRYKPSMDPRDAQMETPLFLSLVNTSIAFQTAKLVKMLLHAGADVNAATVRGTTPLHQACMLGNTRLVEILLLAKADVFILDKKGKLPIQYAGKTYDSMVELFSKHTNCCGVERHQKMWAHIMSRDFVLSVFREVEPSCPVCRRKFSECAVLRTANFRYWLFVHDRDMS